MTRLLPDTRQRAKPAHFARPWQYQALTKRIVQAAIMRQDWHDHDFTSPSAFHSNQRDTLCQQDGHPACDTERRGPCDTGKHESPVELVGPEYQSNGPLRHSLISHTTGAQVFAPQSRETVASRDGHRAKQYIFLQADCCNRTPNHESSHLQRANVVAIVNVMAIS